MITKVTVTLNLTQQLIYKVSLVKSLPYSIDYLQTSLLSASCPLCLPCHQVISLAVSQKRKKKSFNVLPPVLQTICPHSPIYPSCFSRSVPHHSPAQFYLCFYPAPSCLLGNLSSHHRLSFLFALHSSFPS